MRNRIFEFADSGIRSAFYLLFFLVPLVLTPFNYELFEYNKMMLTYAITVCIAGAWIIHAITNRTVSVRRTPLDIPILLFLGSQIISTVFSIDPHVSLWGYYSRFNGGFISIASYILLYFAFVTHFPKQNIPKLITVILVSAMLVSLYGILEHVGIDKHLWVQDVQNRVFSTLGQPNWLAAYLAVLIPVAIEMGIRSKPRNEKAMEQWSNGAILYWVLALVFYTTLIFTKSRSGFVGFWIADIMLWSLLFIQYRILILRSLLTLHFGLFILNFFFGSPFPQINRFTFSELTRQQADAPVTQQEVKPIGGSIIEVGITESGVIRQIVWKGALDVAKQYPLFGSGVETFAFSYYQFRPAEHNMTSEWDFLYNKAHNEYLNYAATTGFVGLGTYVLLIGWFIIWNLKKFKTQMSNVKTTTQYSKLQNNSGQFHTSYFILHTSLFSAWLSILVTNFFGFSVVIIQLFFFLIPAILMVMSGENFNRAIEQSSNRAISIIQRFGVLAVIFALCALFFALAKTWYADTLFAKGYQASRSAEYSNAYTLLSKAYALNPKEPFYADEFALSTSTIALALHENGQSTLSAQLARDAAKLSDQAVKTSPHNVNFWKTRTRIFYGLSELDSANLPEAMRSLEMAKTLSPTDPKIRYNLALIQAAVGKNEEAYQELIDAGKLKPDYRDAFFALALFYERDKQNDKAKETLNYILTRINPNDEEVKKKLEVL